MLLVSSPHQHTRRTVTQIMLLVAIALVPGIMAQSYFFGPGLWIHGIIAIVVALLSESLVLAMRNKPIVLTLKDGSALVTAILLAVSIPPLAPWWITIIGTLFAIVIVKQLYGGLGFNLFNPAMAGYILLLISFPVEMTGWLPPSSLAEHPVTFSDSISVIFSGFSIEGYNLSQLALGIDGYSMATPLDTVKTQLAQNFTLSEILSRSEFSGWHGVGWFWVNLAYFAGGLFLLKIRVIHWHIPTAVLVTLSILALLFFAVDSDRFTSPWFHIFSGAAMIGAFFIATDPVSASTTPKGKLVYGALIGLLIYIIRVFGGYPDAIAFAVIIANMAVPLIDYYTRPAPYGSQKS